MAKSYKINMTEGSLLPKILLFSLPLMLSSILQLLFNAADVIVVGQFAGSQSLAAVSSTGALVNLITNLFIGLSIGSNVIVARNLGAGKYKETSEAVATSIMIALFGGLAIGVIGFLFARPLLEMMSSPANVIDLSTLYLKIYFFGMPAVMLYNYGAAILRAQGDTKRPLYFLTLAGVLNVLMNLFFVIVLKLNVAGVALATILSQYVSAYLVVQCLIQDPGAIHLDPRHMKLNREAFVSILKIGLPAGLQGTVFSLSNVVIQASVNSFGSVVMAGNGAAGNIEGFVYVAMNAFYQACLTFTGQNLGAGKKERINRILFTCLGCVTAVGLLLGIGASRLGGILLSVYSSDPAVIAAGETRLAIICACYALCGIMDTLCGAIRGLGSSIMPMIVSLLGACAFRLLWIATIFQTHHTIENLYYSYPVSWLITAAAHLICYLYLRRKMNRTA